MKRRGNREGSIYKRKDGRWCGAVLLGYDFEGKPIRKYIYGKTRREVAEKLSKLLQDRDTGLLTPSKENYTLGQWLELWLKLYKKPQLRQTTYDRYLTVIRNHLSNRIAGIPLERLRTEHLQGLYLHMEKQGLSRSIRMLHTLINGSLKQAMKLGYVSRNVAEAATLPRKKQKEMKVLSEEELERFLESAKTFRLYPAFLLLISTGLRRGELLGLKWEDIDWDKKMIMVRRNLVEYRGKVVFQEPKTKNSCRTIPLTETALEELKNWRKKWLEERLRLGPEWPETELVFPSRVHTPERPRNFLRTFKVILEKAGLPPDVTIHSLRHTYATSLLKSGEHPKIVQELLGHSSITTTLDIYSRVMPGLKEQAQKKMENFLRKIMQKQEKE